MPRVLLVGPMPPTKGGVTTFMLNLMASPLARRVTFIPFTTSRPPKQGVVDNWGYAALLRGGPRRIAMGALVTLWHVLLFPRAVLRADLVQIQASDYQVFWESALYVLIARWLRRPVLLRIGGAFDLFHGGASRLERRLIGAALCLPDLVIAQSAFAHGVIQQAGRAGPIIVLPNWCAALPEPAVRTAAIPTCLFIGGQEAVRKGLSEVVAAARLLAGRGVAFRLVAVPPALAASLRDIPGVTAEGPLPHAAMLAAMQECDIFLLPSHGEGFPNSLVEAMAAGMACIATPVGAVPEMAAGGGVQLVPVRDPASLAAAIAAVAGSAPLRLSLGEKARRTVKAHYVPDAALPALADAYASLSCDPARPGAVRA